MLAHTTPNGSSAGDGIVGPNFPLSILPYQNMRPAMYLGVLAATSANVDATKSIILQGTNQAAQRTQRLYTKLLT